MPNESLAIKFRYVANYFFSGEVCINILRAAFAPILFHQKFRSQNVSRKKLAHNFNEIDSWCQFHQRFTCNFCVHEAQQRKKYSQVVSLLTLLGSEQRAQKVHLNILVKLTPV